MLEIDDQVYENRLSRCPIHQWRNVDLYLEKAGGPEKYNRLFHELVLVRGEYPKIMTDDDSNSYFGQRDKVMQRIDMRSSEVEAFDLMFILFVANWVISTG